MDINFEMTWCDYLTPCPYKSDIEVGSFACASCEYFVSFKNYESVPPGEYFTVKTGCVECNFKSE